MSAKAASATKLPNYDQSLRASQITQRRLLTETQDVQRNAILPKVLLGSPVSILPKTPDRNHSKSDQDDSYYSKRTEPESKVVMNRLQARQSSAGSHNSSQQNFWQPDPTPVVFNNIAPSFDNTVGSNQTVKISNFLKQQ